MRMLSIFLIGLFFSNYLHADSPKTLELAKGQFHEKYNANVTVSGRVIAGIIAKSSGTLSDFQVNLLDINEETMCLRVQSIDGTYYSTNEYRINDKEFKGLINPDYPTQYKELLNGFDESELAILAFAGECGKKKITDAYISARNTNFTQNTITVFVSSGRSEVFLGTTNKEGKKKTIKCSRIEQGKRTAYDTECNIDISQLYEGINSITVLRRKSGRMLPSIKFNVVYGS